VSERWKAADPQIAPPARDRCSAASILRGCSASGGLSLNKKYLPIINGQRTVEEIARSRGSRFHTYKSIYFLLANAWWRRALPNLRPPAIHARSGKRSVGSCGGSFTADTGRDPVTPSDPGSLCSTGDAGPLQILGVDKTISPGELKKVYFRLQTLPSGPAL